jgi:hypothetical protein
MESMSTKGNEKKSANHLERRKGKRPRRRLVDLTLKAGTNRREVKEERRQGSTDLAT